jgi:hypothetical protein
LEDKMISKSALGKGAVVAAFTAGILAMGTSGASADVLDLELEAGTQSFVLAGAGVDFGNIGYSLGAQNAPGETTFTLANMLGNGSGFTTTVNASTALVSGSDLIGATAISYDSLATSIVGATTPDGGNPAQVTQAASGAIDTPRTVFSSLVAEGEGVFGGTLGLRVAVPAAQAPGTYAGTLVVAITPVV